MRPDISEIEYHELFVKEIRNLRFSIEQMGKMLESHLETFTKHMCDNNLNKQEIKDFQSEIIRALDGYELAAKALTENLKIRYQEAFEIFEQKISDKKPYLEKITKNERKLYLDAED